MKLKLIDIVDEVDYDVQFGTCELCMYVSDLYYNTYVVEDEKGERHNFVDGCWSWGDWMPILSSYRDMNVIELAEWVNQQEFIADEYGEYEYDFFGRLQQHIWDLEGEIANEN